MPPKWAIEEGSMKATQNTQLTARLSISVSNGNVGRASPFAGR